MFMTYAMLSSKSVVVNECEYSQQPITARTAGVEGAEGDEPAVDVQRAGEDEECKNVCLHGRFFLLQREGMRGV